MAGTKKSGSKAAPPARRARSAKAGAYSGDSLLTRPLGLEGWKHLDAVLLAAITSETPLLLVGQHGCAKSFFLETLARALKLEFRFYNASLINYDDLVGIPIPSADRRSLEYISTPSSIWDAEVVFMDEINRTKPELQNKLFPIIHDRRVQGVSLEKLRFRWAAMNPPSPEADVSEVAYLGAEPLDTALADRFGFIIEVPSWKRLSDAEKRAILSDQFTGNHPFPVAIDKLIEGARARLEAAKQMPHPEIEDYLILLSGELTKIGLDLSTRRMTMLYANILALHAAAETLSAVNEVRTAPSWGESAWNALQHSLPQLAEGTAPDLLKIRTAHLQAWQLMQTSAETAERALLIIADPLERAIEAVRRVKVLSSDILSACLVNCITDAGGVAERSARTLAIYLATHQSISLPNTALAAMKSDLARILAPRTFEVEVKDAHLEHVERLAAKAQGNGGTEEERVVDHHSRNLAQHVYEQTEMIRDCKTAEKRFRELLKYFNAALAA